MSNILTFALGRRRRARAPRARGGPCEIVIFPGVRIERTPQASDKRAGAEPVAKPVSGRTA